MSAVLQAFGAGVRDLFSLRVLWIVVWPMLVAGLVWLVAGVVFWGTFSAWIAQALAWIGVDVWLTAIEPVWISALIQGFLHLILFIPLVTLTALLITAIFAMPALVRLVAERDYPALEKRRGGGFAGSVVNALVALLAFVGLWVASLPLWLLGVGVLLSLAATVYLNQRLFRYDAIAEHADATEMRALFAEARGSWWALGALVSLVQFVPLLNFLAPVLAALSFVHFGLARLAERRR
jgi:hypothetical protein